MSESGHQKGRVMRFNDSDVQPNTPRPLSQCGSMVAPGQDLRWRGLATKHLYQRVVVINGFGFHQDSIDTLDRVEFQQAQRGSQHAA